ncbi:hypothetical protein [Flammeovirga pacifica]|uniref:Uncharacterized protein n=1 Tax=Flammeovirga pacifica TaxID=915059 RepID=A0A1S1Z289_FLAPC|nr:hypothetical protein [Flammeovirga pacifica]OHX67388.1 hypothetical protein NH26_14055 [Flammeovirga pacifica]
METTPIFLETHPYFLETGLYSWKLKKKQQNRVSKIWGVVSKITPFLESAFQGVNVLIFN